MTEHAKIKLDEPTRQLVLAYAAHLKNEPPPPPNTEDPRQAQLWYAKETGLAVMLGQRLIACALACLADLDPDSDSDSAK